MAARIVIRVPFMQATPDKVSIAAPGVACNSHARVGPCGMAQSRWIKGIQERLTTTPGRLRLAAVLLAVGAIVFGALAGSAVSARRQAAHSVATDTEPLLVTAEGLYASLSDADATAATTFLTGGLEPPARRERYAGDMRAASGQLATLARQAGGSAQTRAAVRTLATQLPVYSGLVETARTNKRQGFPVGAEAQVEFVL